MLPILHFRPGDASYRPFWSKSVDCKQRAFNTASARRCFLSRPIDGSSHRICDLKHRLAAFEASFGRKAAAESSLSEVDLVSSKGMILGNVFGDVAWPERRTF
jgi:hypothetical protein